MVVRRHGDGGGGGNSMALWGMMVMVVALWGVGTNAEDHPIPKFIETLAGSYSLTVEMSNVIENETYYVEEVHERRLYHDMLSDTQAVKVQKNGSFLTHHFFPEKNEFVEENENGCHSAGEQEGDHFWGWYDIDPAHGSKNFGPSSILRLASYEDAVYESGADDVAGVYVETWQVSLAEGDIVIHYRYSLPTWETPEAGWFSEGGGSLPIEFEVVFADGSLVHKYYVVKFLPWAEGHHLLEPGRGKSCEAMVGVETDAKVPSIPWHFSMSEEIVIEPEIDGVSIGVQHVDKIRMTYASKLSLVALLVTPPITSGHPQSYAIKVIHDFNTGVQYEMYSEFGNCSMGFIPANGFDTHYGGFLGTSGVMMSPNEMFHLDNDYAFVGDGFSRGISGDRWTSTRIDDIPDPMEGGIQTLPKAVLEYDFSQGEEMTPSGDRIRSDLPYRGDLYGYNRSDDHQVVGMLTTNFYDFTVINLVSESEFSVEACYEKRSDDWSFLDVFFPADHEDQFNAVRNREKKFKDLFITKLIEIGRISPVRIASVDVSIGLAGALPNTTNANVIIVRTQLLERAPYIYSYYRPSDEPIQTPGENEEKLEDIRHLETCAELCSIEKDFDCKSFHHCQDSTCYLSKLETSDGDPVEVEGDCFHWITGVDNETFPDYPTAIVYEEVLDAIVHGQFIFGFDYQNTSVGYEASASIIYKTPDPLDVVRSQFRFELRSMTLVNPDSVEQGETPDDCLFLCVTWREFRCETVVHQERDSKCLLSRTHFHDFNATDFKPHDFAYVYARSYLNDYSPVLGGIALNTTGPIYTNISHLDECARFCSKETSIQCESFEWCFGERVCHLHSERYLDVVDGGNYLTGTSCIHYSKRDDQLFSRYPHQSLTTSQHHLVSSHTTPEACAKLCVEDMDEVCQSYDFCTSCISDDYGVCSEDNEGTTNLCYLTQHHVGEPDLKLTKAVHCDHYSRDVFGDQDYASWVASQRKSNKPYTPGAMTGLAFGMIFLGILLVIGSLALVSAFKPTAVPKDLALNIIPSRSAGSVAGESDI